MLKSLHFSILGRFAAIKEEIREQGVANSLKRISARAGEFDCGGWLEEQRGKTGLWKKRFYNFLAVLVFLNIFFGPVEPHFGLDAWFGFWPLFGFGTGLAMIWIMKKIIQPIIVRKEDYYHDL